MSFLQYLKTKIVLIICLIIGGCVMTFFVCDICSTSFGWFVKVASFTTAIWLSMWLGNEYMSHFLDKGTHQKIWSWYCGDVDLYGSCGFYFSDGIRERFSGLCGWPSQHAVRISIHHLYHHPFYDQPGIPP
jgi:hypothetical protein